MNIAFYNGVSGMMAYQTGLDIIGHNVANVGTVGFKRYSPAFSDLLYTQMAVNGEEEHRVGHGTKVAASNLIMNQGVPLMTGHLMDTAILGEGFFALEALDGETTYYTRNGSFDISVEKDKGFLVNDEGLYVLDAKGKRIELPVDEETGNFDVTSLPDLVGVYVFENPYALTPVDGTRYRENELSGEAEATDAGFSLVTQTLEQSSVDLGEEMVQVIMMQRGFQINAKMVQTADQIEEIVNNLR